MRGARVRRRAISAYAACDRYFRQGTALLYVDSHAGAAWPAANRAIYIPFELDRPMLVTQMYTINGGTVSGNLDVGIYTADGTRLVNKGSTAQTGATAIQAFDITDTYLDRGAYFMALAMDNTTGQIFRLNPGGANDFLVWGGLQQASAFALPATATFAVNTTQYIPFFGLTGMSMI